MWNVFEGQQNNFNDINLVSLLLTFTYSSGVSISDFEQVNADSVDEL